MLQCDYLSKYRSQIMGASTVLILLCHAPAYVSFPPWMSSILTRGGWGVDIFLFVSGLGLFNSLSTLKNFTILTLGQWYRRRFKRLLIPYFFCYFPFRIVQGVIVKDPFLDVLGDVSTLSFWTRHGGAWFVALIIPLYLLAPFLYRIFSRLKNDYSKLVLLILLISLCVVFSVYDFHGIEHHSFIFNLQFAFSRIPAFILGLFSGYYVLKHYTIKYPIILSFIIILGAYTLKNILPALCVSSFMAIPTIYLLVCLFSREYKHINEVCAFMGRISLESYLFNGVLPFFLINQHLMIFGVDLFYGNYLSYAIVVLLGTLLSYQVSKLISKIF